MMKSSAFLQDYTVFLVDAYGVFWDGSGFIPGTRERLEGLVSAGKIVVILSNATQRTTVAMEKYAAHGLVQGQHYHALVTSGEVARQELEKGLELEGRHVRRYYTLGTRNMALFEGLDYSATSLEEAEFVYIGVPQLNNSEKEALGDSIPLYASYSKQPDGGKCWDATDIEAFRAMLAPVVARGLPVFSANPDKTAPEKCKITEQVHPVIRQGMIAETLRNAGLSVREIGKPYTEIYAYCRALLAREYGLTAGAKTVMVGDTLATDIRGAQLATTELGWPVDAILTLTGNTAQGIDASNKRLMQEYLATQCRKEGCAPHYIMTSFGEEGEVYVFPTPSYAARR